MSSRPHWPTPACAATDNNPTPLNIPKPSHTMSVPKLPRTVSTPVHKATLLAKVLVERPTLVVLKTPFE